MQCLINLLDQDTVEGLCDSSLRLTVLVFTKMFLLWFCNGKSTSAHKYFTQKLFAFLNKNHLF